GLGHGKLRTYRALHGTDPTAANTAPLASLTVTIDQSTAIFDGTESADPDGDPLQYRFDLDHDGRWETDWRRQGRLRRPVDTVASENGPAIARLEVRDSHGARRGALAEVASGASADEPRPDARPSTDADDLGADPAPPADPSNDGLFGCSTRGRPRPGSRILLVFGLLVLTSLVQLRR
ncbi:MAG: hypothetical protein ABEN55_12925, partial [Bradymonadaceae bacterium]